METIDERVDEYTREHMYHGGYDIEDVRSAYMDGMLAEHDRLTRWHDPKEELPPIYDNVLVKYMALDGCEHVAIAWRSAGDAGGCTYAISGTGVTINSRNIVGWREIHE